MKWNSSRNVEQLHNCLPGYSDQCESHELNRSGFLPGPARPYQKRYPGRDISYPAEPSEEEIERQTETEEVLCEGRKGKEKIKSLEQSGLSRIIIICVVTVTKAVIRENKRVTFHYKGIANSRAKV